MTLTITDELITDELMNYTSASAISTKAFFAGQVGR